MHDTLQYMRTRPDPPPVPPQRAHVPAGLRVHGELRAAAVARRGGAREGLAARQDARRRLAAVRQPPPAVRLPCGRSPARSSCSWATSSASAANGTTTRASTGTCWRTRGTAASCGGCGDLNALYRAEPALHELDDDPRRVRVDRREGRRGRHAVLPAPRADRPATTPVAGGVQLHPDAARALPGRRARTAGVWREALNSDAEIYGGTRRGQPRRASRPTPIRLARAPAAR